MAYLNLDEATTETSLVFLLFDRGTDQQYVIPPKYANESVYTDRFRAYDLLEIGEPVDKDTQKTREINRRAATRGSRPIKVSRAKAGIADE